MCTDLHNMSIIREVGSNEIVRGHTGMLTSQDIVSMLLVGSGCRKF